MLTVCAELAVCDRHRPGRDIVDAFARVCLTWKWLKLQLAPPSVGYTMCEASLAKSNVFLLFDVGEGIELVENPCPLLHFVPTQPLVRVTDCQVSDG